MRRRSELARIEIESPSRRFQAEFLAAARSSRAFHRRWGAPPTTPAGFALLLARQRSAQHEAHFLVESASGRLVGAANLSDIVRGAFLSAHLGYYLFEPYEGRGYMTEGVQLVLGRAFGELGLHRVEANIQPGNARSIRLVRRLGFRREGYSPRYLKVAGRWRDHERWALLAEDWRR
jgi:ribosomal-protein-alanine N-acetyltransferase